jgi:hypothetical protein
MDSCLPISRGWGFTTKSGGMWFKQLLLRFEHIQWQHYGMKLLAYTLINLREFCGT